MSHQTSLNRRRFLQTAALLPAAAGLGVHSELPAAESASPNEKLRIGIIGTANRARANINGVKQEQIAAICDIDANYLGKVQQEFPQAAAFADFRKMLDEQHKQLDAVVVSTADHTHAPASYFAMQLKKHVYCEKPLTHTVWEARKLAEIAKQQNVATQMGIVIHEKDNYRRVVEIVRSGVLGKIKQVHTFVPKGWGGGDRPKEEQPVPAHISWDLWLGPAAMRPYHSVYLPANWRRFWEFGGGTLGDMACHHMDLPFWAMNLRAPSKIKATGPEVHPDTCPLGLQVDYTFAATAEQPEFTLTWYDGNRVPKTILDVPTGGGGNLFVGEKGMLRADYDTWKLYPETEFEDYQPPAKTIPSSVGHFIEGINACKTSSATTCNFDYSGALTEAVLLGNVAFRSGKELHYNAADLKFTNATEAESLLTKSYRAGWELK